MAEPDTSPARRAPVISDVARLAGVSLGTVSNVLNQPDLVAEATRDRVNAAIAELGFVRNRNARSLRSGRDSTLGFVVVDLANSYFVDIARGVESLTDERGYKLLMANSDVSADKQSDFLRLLEEYRVAGALLAPLDGPLGVAEEVRQRGLPVVNVNWPGEGGTSCGVVVDEAWGGYIATRHVLQRGVRRLAFVGGPLGLRAVAQRWAGAQRAVAEVPGASITHLATDRLSVRAGLQVGVQLAGDLAYDGIVAAADALASGVVQSLAAQGVRTPEDVLVIGYDNNHFASETAVPLSTVSQPGREIGRLAAELLIDEITRREAHVHRTVVVKPELIGRQSTARSHPSS